MPRDKDGPNQRDSGQSGSGQTGSGQRSSGRSGSGQRGSGRRASLSRNDRRSDRRRTAQPSPSPGSRPGPGTSGTGPDRANRNDRPRASKELLAELRQTAIEQAETLQTGDDWLRLLRYAEHFLPYGAINALLILRDRPYATRLATYDQWKHDGDPVQRGEHGLTLLDPADPRRTLRVFDITQTGQAPAPGPLRRLRPARHAAKPLQAALTSFATRKGFDVCTNAIAVKHDRTFDIPARTAFDEGTIHLHPQLSPDAACYALAHELAHVLLHEPERLNPVTGACDGQRLTEAESTAYLLCRNAGLDVTPFTFPDPPTWAGPDPRANRGTKILTALEHITGAAQRLITQVDADAPQWPPPDRLAVRTASETTTTQPALATPATPAPAVRKPEPRRDPRLVDIHRSAEQFFTARLPGSWVPGYLAGRGLAAALDPNAPWGIGYAPATWTALVDHLHAAGYTDQEIITSGLGQRSRKGGLIDRFRDRAMLPVRDPDGTTIAFIGRANPNTTSTSDRPVPKYLNSPNTPLYSKGAVLYGLDAVQERLRHGAIPILVEGTLDAIAIHIADPGHRYAPVAPSGTALTEQQVSALNHAVDLRERGIMAAFDGDFAGQRAAARAHRLLCRCTHRLHHARLDAGDDPAGLLENHGPHRLLTELSNRQPLAIAVLDAHLAVTDGRPEWQRREEAAQLIAELTPPDKTRQLAEANRPTPHSSPNDEVFLPASKVADLLPYVTKALALRAADAIGISVTDQLNALITAATDHTGKTPKARVDDDQNNSPAELAARDGPTLPIAFSSNRTPTAPRPEPTPARSSTRAP